MMIVKAAIAAPVAALVGMLIHAESALSKPFRSSPLEITLTMRPTESAPVRPCPTSERSEAPECWILFADEVPVHGVLELRVSHEASGETRDADLRQVEVQLPQEPWWSLVVWHLESARPDATLGGAQRIATGPEGPAAKPAGPRLRAGEPRTAPFTTTELPVGEYTLSATLEWQTAPDGIRVRVATDPVALLVRTGTEDPQTRELRQGALASRAVAAGNFPAFERIQVDWLTAHPSSVGWELLADRSIGRVPLETTARYYTSAITELQREKLRRPAGREGAAAEDQAFAERLAQLESFTRLLPYLRANDELVLVVLRPHPNKLMALTGPNLSLRFSVTDEAVLRQLR